MGRVSWSGRMSAGALAACAVALCAGGVVSSASATAPSRAVSQKGSPPPSLSALEKALQAEQKLTFKVVYSISTKGQPKQTVTFEQKPPNALIATKGGEFLQVGSKDYFCANAGKVICIAEKGTASPLAALTGFFSPAILAAQVKGLQAEAAAKGVSITTSSKTVGGQSSSCYTASRSGQSVTYCVTSKGLLSYLSSATTVVQLTSYSLSPPPSDFQLPKGATISSISIP